ncbi:MAG: hypothetical protein KBA31_16825 [Alphaproteobacteria bacterium]|nr:hypothetical protein [Alphaproteobacteria bacterium]
MTANSAPRQPWLSYLLLLVLGIAPTFLVSHYYGVLPSRMVVQWDAFGKLTVIATQAKSVLLIANVAAVIALTAIAIALWQRRALVAFKLRRAYLMLNMAQIVVINLTCAMLVTDALGYGLKLKPSIPPGMALLLFASGVLIWRLEQGRSSAMRVVAIGLLVGALALLAFSAIAANAVVGYYASAFALLAMAALVLPGAR